MNQCQYGICDGLALAMYSVQENLIQLVWSKNGGIYFHAFRRALSIEMMENIYDEDD
jgi:hypothetical protein